jgi:hypothetical protein
MVGKTRVLPEAEEQDAELMPRLLLLITVVALAANVAVASPAHAGVRYPYPWNPTIHCGQPGGGCVITSAGNYNSCTDLGLQRGFNLGKGDRHYLDRFVYQCLTGRVPR